jgi:hypothetical protein
VEDGRERLAIEREVSTVKRPDCLIRPFKSWPATYSMVM